ncbi:MAG: hypothetical protein ACQ9MH_26700 [Nitrospinales bacterium]
MSIFIGKNVPCYSANRELRVSMSELSHRMNIYVMAIANVVQRAEKIAKEYDASPADKKIEKIIDFGFH